MATNEVGRPTADEYLILQENSQRIASGLQENEILFAVATGMFPDQASLFKSSEQLLAEILRRAKQDPRQVFEKLVVVLSEIPSLVALAEELAGKHDVFAHKESVNEAAALNPHQSSPGPGEEHPIPFQALSESDGQDVFLPPVENAPVQPNSTGINDDQVLPSTQETVHTSELVCGNTSTLQLQQELSEYGNRVGAAEKTLVVMRRKVNRNRDTLDEKRLSTLEEGIEKQRHSIHLHRHQVINFEEELGELKTQCSEMKERVKKVESDQADSAQKISDLQKDLGESQEEVKAVRKLSQENMQALRKKSREEKEAYESSLQKLEAKFCEDKEALESNIAEMKTRVEKMYELVQQSHKNMKTEVDPEMAALKTEVDSLDSIQLSQDRELSCLSEERQFDSVGDDSRSSEDIQPPQSSQDRQLPQQDGQLPRSLQHEQLSQQDGQLSQSSQDGQQDKHQDGLLPLSSQDGQLPPSSQDSHLENSTEDSQSFCYLGCCSKCSLM